MDAELARGLHPTTLKSILDRVYTVLRYLADQGDLATLPARPALRLPDPLPRHLAPQEVLAIEARLERCADRPSAEEQPPKVEDPFAGLDSLEAEMARLLGRDKPN